jgi:hypothetical protein
MVKTMGGATSSVAMKLRSLLLASLMLTGCAASEAESASTASDIVAAPQPDVQHFAISQAEQDAVIERFTLKNPELVLSDYTAVNDLTGGVKDFENIKPLGPNVFQTGPEVVALATAFLEKNAAEFGLTQHDIATADILAQPYPFDSGRFPWSVSFRRVTRTPGYEGFDTVDRQIAISIDFNRDGTIGRGYNATSYFPNLHLSTKPALPAGSFVLVSEIIGTELVWHDDSFLMLPDLAVGRVPPSAIGARRPVIHQTRDASGVTLTLAYEIEVSMGGGHDWTFVVHHATGAILEQQQKAAWR